MIRYAGKGTLARPTADGFITIEPSQVQIGQPIVCTLVVDHDRADGLPATVPAPFPEGEDWLLLEGPVLLKRTLDGLGVRSEVQWTYMPLQPGDHSTEGYTLTLLRGAPIEFAVADLTVASELTEADVAPRPMAEGLPAPESPAGGGVYWLLGILVLLAILGLMLRSRKQGTASEIVEVDDSLARLRGATWDSSRTESESREQLFAWHRDLRRALDQKANVDRSSLVDSDWMERAQTQLPEPQWQAYMALIDELETHKYSVDSPSRLTGENLASAVQGAARAVQESARSETPFDGANTTIATDHLASKSVTEDSSKVVQASEPSAFHSGSSGSDSSEFESSDPGSSSIGEDV